MVTDKVKGGERQKEVEMGRIISVEKIHVLINIKATSIKMLVSTESRKGGSKDREDKGRTTLTLSVTFSKEAN